MDRVPLDAILRLQVFPLRDFSFNLNSNITYTSFPLSIPQIAAVDECANFSKALKTPQMSLF
jgi:hypothetical protein